MQGHNPDPQGRHHPMAHSSGLLHDRGSPDGSDDDASYLGYPDPHRTDPGVDDDSNAALTSQTLNADGTPKRPMNAFMIFARRRRPQVAAENQSMRLRIHTSIIRRLTADFMIIQSEKQFYLDQAKLLKDNFNQKYPDYVYKRRPNNSRKRRKLEPAPGLSADLASSSDLQDDYAGSADYSDVSPVDVADTDDPRLSGQDVRNTSLPADTSGATYSTVQSRSSSYQPPDAPYRPLGDTRVSYMSRPGHVTPDTGMASSITSASRGLDHGANYYHPYLSAQQQYLAQSSPYFQESSSTGEVWSSVRDDQSRIQMQSWPQNSQDIGGDDRHRGYPQPVSSHGWTNTSTSEAIPSSSSSGASTASFNFPTLTSPFYPPQTNNQEGFSSSSVQPISGPSQHYGTVAPIPGDPVSGRSYPSLQQAYSSGSSSVIGPYQPQARAISIALPSGQPASSYSHAQSTTPPPPAGSGGDPSHMRYWSKER
ncbi:hypothetical protein J3R83DRAFT_5292 [Lanmaoa asiatica]|nr:hypothetical protein J3R83DRAFT_5292 [Lanmaoa asiatica]